MANPYSFVSGFLSAKQLKDVKEYRDKAIEVEIQKGDIEKAYRHGILGPYYEAHTENFKADTNIKKRKYETLEKLDPVINDVIEFFIPKNKKKNDINTGALSVDDDVNAYANNDEYNNKNYGLPIYANNGFYAGDENNIDNNRAAINNDIDGIQLAGVNNVKRKTAVADPRGSSSSNSQPSSSTVDQLETVAPEKANSITEAVYGLKNKDFQKMIGAFSLIRFATGDGTPRELLDNVNIIKKMQVENMGSAMARALAGDSKGALAAFGESGDDRGENVESLKKINIENKVFIPGKKDALINNYDGIEITYKNKEKLILDPRKLMAESIGLAEMLKWGAEQDNKLRDDQIRVDINAETAANRRWNFIQQNDYKRNQMLNNQLIKLEQIGRDRTTNEEKAILDPQNPTYSLNEGLRNSKLKEVRDRRSLINSMAGQYITDSEGESVSYSLYEQAADDRSNVDAFRRGVTKDGKPGLLIKQFGNSPYVQHNNGAYIPLDYTPFVKK